VLFRSFRNYFLREIDRQWLEQLSAMEQLRDGIGLRGYGQRDPKKEYKREGYDLFMGMMERIKGNVVSNMFHVQVVSQEQLEALEAQRRAEAQAKLDRMRAADPATQQQQQQAAGGDGPPGAAPRAAAAPPVPATRPPRRAARARGGAVRPPAPTPQAVRREKPKAGRHGPCWCGSGKKYMHCPPRADQAAAAGSAEAVADQ